MFDKLLDKLMSFTGYVAAAILIGLFWAMVYYLVKGIVYGPVL